MVRKEPNSDALPEVPAPGSMERASIGALLGQARAAAGLSLQQVSERTKVRPGILSAIERDDHLALPALTYTLGFVKAFARTVGIDPQMAADRYRAESQKSEPVPSMVDLEPLEARRLPSRGLVTGMTVLVVLVLGLLTAWGLGWLSAPIPETVAPEAMPAVAQDDGEPQSDVEAPAPAAAAGAPVRLTANAEVWLKISDGPAGETLFMGTMAKGQTLDLPPGRQWQLRTGRAGALDVAVGGTAVPPLGGPAEQVRGLMLTPEALSGRAATAGLAGAAGPSPGLPGALTATDSSPGNPTPATGAVSPSITQDRR